MDYKVLGQAPRVLLMARLRPLQGERFQPTGFVDIGAAVYSRPDVDGKHGTRMLLVESAQSVANRLEKTCLDIDGTNLDPSLKGLPYVVAILQGDSVGSIRTSSLVEPHRLASPYLLPPDFKKTLADEMGCSGKGSLNWEKIYAALFKYDPNSLVHGVFLSLLDGRVRVPRALSGFIEAENVEEAVSGGVKNSPVDPKGEIQVEGGETKDVYSNVPYSRIEYVAEKITAFFNLDTSQIRSYRLGEPAERLLTVLSLLKIRRFLESELRLRTACNLAVSGEIEATQPKGFVLLKESELLEEARQLIPRCKAQFANPAVTELKVPVTRKKAEKTKSGSASKGSEEASGTSEHDNN